MVHGLRPRSADVELQRLDRKLPRRGQVARTVLVMHRQRLGRFLCQTGRTPALGQHPPPCISRLEVTALAPAQDRVGPERFDAGQDIGVQFDRADEACASLRGHAAPLEEAAKAQGLSRRVGGGGAFVKQLTRPCREHGQREHVEPVVFEYDIQPARVAGSDELEVPRRDLEARHIVLADMAEDALFHQREPAGGFSPAQVEIHGWAPEAARRVQQVDVGKPAAWRHEAVKQEAGVDERGVERLAVVCDENAGRAHERGDFLQQQPLGGKAGKYELTDAKYPAVEPPASDEKRVGARASSKAGRLEIEKQQPSTRGGDRRLCEQQLQSRPSPFISEKAVGDGHATQTISGVIGAIDDEAAMTVAFVPFAAQRLCGVAARRT